MTDSATRTRGRRGRDRHIAERVSSTAGARPAGGASAGDAARPRVPDLAVLPGLLARSGELEALVERFARARDGRATGLRHVTYAAIPHGAKTFLAAALVRASGERLVWVARDAEIADRVAEELQAWIGDPAAVVTLEPRSSLAYERSELIRDESAARVAALAAWRAGDATQDATIGPAQDAAIGPARVLVTSVQALFQRTLAPDALPTEPLTIRRGARLSQERVLRSLLELGYEAVAEVGGRGEFTRRGGIVDCFPAGQPLPVRIEWFGDEIDSLRAFDPADQRGVGAVERTVLLPASEFLFRAADQGPEGATDWLRARLGRLGSKLSEPLQQDLARLANGQLSDAAEIWGGILAPASGLHHLGDAIWLLDEPQDVHDAGDSLRSQAEERRAEMERAGELPKGWADAYPTAREWKRALVEARTLELTWESEADGAPPGGNPFGWHEPVMPPQAITSLAPTISRWRREGARVVLTSDQSARLSEILAEADIVAAPTAHLVEAPPAGGLALVERS
ncbi:MAG: hypothetical protein M3432_02170, partial [Chloroflexota bacterium]|nr:hypothetical protein [Chloroflexota bacterium]